MSWGYRLVAASETPPGDDWLSGAERRILERLPVERRRSEWLSGRWAAKEALAAWLGLGRDLAARRRIEVLPGVERAPHPLLDEVPAPVALSLSHRAGRALAVVGSPDLALGCDLERTEPRSRLFVHEYFTEAEAAALATAPHEMHDLVANLVWSAKESALKLVLKGLSIPTRSVEAVPSLLAERSDGWLALTVVSLSDGERFSGWWRRHEDLVLTALSRPPLPPPRELLD